MLSGEKILVTGATGQIGLPLAEYLARDNNVWGLARFGDAEARYRAERAGIVPVAVDLDRMDLVDVPRDFTVLLHLAAFQGGGEDYDYALRVNCEATGVLLTHCAQARAALVMSTGSVYRPVSDPLHPYAEGDALGDARLAHSATYSVAKIAQEAVARAYCRTLDLPVTIARMNVAYGTNGGLPAHHLTHILEGRPVRLRSHAQAYTPIFQEDINLQVGAMVQAASTPATIVNWAGDEVVNATDWCRYLASLAGVDLSVEIVNDSAKPHGTILESEKRHGITGPCQYPWQEGMRLMYLGRSGSSDAGREGRGS